MTKLQFKAVNSTLEAINAEQDSWLDRSARLSRFTPVTLNQTAVFIYDESTCYRYSLMIGFAGKTMVSDEIVAQ
jgi:hypothetical protein